jgi:hypothetical protein
MGHRPSGGCPACIEPENMLEAETKKPTEVGFFV